MTVCPALASSPGRGACFSLKENKSLNENDKLRAEDVFFSYSQSAGSSSCCNPAIKIVFHSAFTLYITEPTTAPPPPSNHPPLTPLFAHVDSLAELKKRKKNLGTDNLPAFFSYPGLKSRRVFGLL